MKLILYVFILLMSAVLPCSAGKVITNPTLGFEIELPDGWTEFSAQQFYENLGKVELNDPKLQDLLRKNANVPVVMAAKYPEPYNDVNPSLKINVRPYGSLATRDAVEISGLATASIKKLFADLEVVSPPVKAEVSRKLAGHVRVKYTMKTDAGSFPIESELWIIPTANFFYMIGIGYRPDGRTGSREEAASSIETMKILTP